MPLPDITLHTLEEYTASPPPSERDWYDPWATILGLLFPATDNFAIKPQALVVDEDDHEHTIPDFVIEVCKMTRDGDHEPRVVLLVEIKNSHFWPNGVNLLSDQMVRQVNGVFSHIPVGSRTVYWIGVVGPHWRYGRKDDDGQTELTPLIPWHHTTHDDASFDDLQILATLVRAL